MYKLSNSSKERLNGVNPGLIKVIDIALQISPIDFGIPQYGGLRTAEEQRVIFDDGKSKCDGYDKKSNHQSGNAFDVYAYVDGKASWDESHLALVATAVLSAASKVGVPLTWGGHWKSFKDLPHFEVDI